MNCPHHCEIYAHKPYSYKDLPVRFAEFGTVYRYEQSGELHGLTRVRGFTQDDAHIFCRPDQVDQEILSCLDFLDYIYNICGFTYELELSTRPEKAIGSIEMWKNAEDKLKLALDKSGKKWKLNPGDGAF
jgi:threonyl-tRNA synthetase